jgi:glycosyltransferase involved in cell wall biosynthesis
MRVLHVISTFADEYGGPVTACRDLCRELMRRGIDVSILTTNWSGTTQTALDEMTTPPGARVRVFPVQSPRRWWFSPEMWRAMGEEVRKHDVVHAHMLWAFPPSAAAIWSRWLGVPYVLHPHGCLDPFILMRHRWQKRAHQSMIDRRNIANAATVLYTTEEERRRAPAPGTVVPLGIDLPDRLDSGAREEMYRRWPALRGHKVILFLGRLHAKKGLDLLTRAFVEIARRRDDVMLLMAGPDDGMETKMRAWLRAKGLEHRAVFAGMLRGEQKRCVLDGSDVFVLSSYFENFAIAVAEAMAHRLPVVISKGVYIWREVAAGGAGLVVDCDAGQLEAALQQVLDDDALAHKMGVNGQRVVREKFGWREVGDQMVELYRSAIAGSAADLIQPPVDAMPSAAR